MSKSAVDLAFDRWVYTALVNRYKMDGPPVPMLTILLHRVCNGNPDRLGEAIDILRVAFRAGARSATEPVVHAEASDEGETS